MIQLHLNLTSSFLTAPTTAATLHALTLPDLHCWLVVDSCVAHALLDLAGHGQEGLLDVACVLGGGLEEWDAEAVREFLRLALATPSRFC